MSFVQGEDGAWHEPPGYAALWSWFGLTRASWLTMPRVLMHEMPDDWQARMAALCEEWDEHWDAHEMPTPAVQAVGSRGKFTRWPDWLLDYRHPRKEKIDALRRPAP